MAPGVLVPEEESTTYYVPESSRKQNQSYASTEVRGKTRDFEAQSKRVYGDWRDDFFKQGYSLVKHAIPRERALSYQKRALDWLQKFNLGLDYNDPSTFNSEHLPVMMNGGMVLNYCAAHEDWVWQTRCEDGVIKPFTQLWETDELLVSFDAVNITLPDRKDVAWRPWPHVDQAPTRSGLACAQGVVLLSDAGPKDGGLIVMRGSAALFEQYFRENPPAEKPADAPGQFDWYGYKVEELKWFQERGCEMIKVEAEAGDMIIWDSRCIHHASLPENGKIRTVVYAAYTPRSLASEKDLELKQQCFKRWEGTTHWPHCNIFAQGKAYRNGEICPGERDEPLEKPELTDKLLKLAGMKAY